MIRTKISSLICALFLSVVTGCISHAEDWVSVPVDKGDATPAVLPIAVAPDNANLRYSGRFDLTDPAVAVCSWPASAVTLRFRGTAVNASLAAGKNRFQVVLDGVPVKILAGAAGKPGPRLYALASNLPAGDHTVTLFKNTEPFVGNATFAGFQIAGGGQALPAIVPTRKIEVIGDSISAGYGNEAATKEEHFTPETQNAYWTYGAIAARELGADYTCIAWSGRTMWPSNTIPEVYDRILGQKAEPKWPGDAVKPDVYVINLGTNEFQRKEVIDEDGWVRAYRDFIGKLRVGSPQAVVYLALSPMMNDSWPPERKTRSTTLKYLQRIARESAEAGDSRVKVLEFATQDGNVDGLGADWHPNVKTNQKMAAKLVAAIKADLGW